MMPDVIDYLDEKKKSGRPLSVRLSAQGSEKDRPAPLSDRKTLYLQMFRFIRHSTGSASGRRPVPTEVCADIFGWSSLIYRKPPKEVFARMRGKAVHEPFGIAWKAAHPNFRKGFALTKRLSQGALVHETLAWRAQRLVRMGRIEPALDLIYDAADHMMRKGEFAQLDSVLANVRVSDLSVDILLAILTATLPAKSRLPSRTRFFNEIEKSLRDRDEYEDGLLTGLE
jgi:hypothetical protein